MACHVETVEFFDGCSSVCSEAADTGTSLTGVERDDESSAMEGAIVEELKDTDLLFS